MRYGTEHKQQTHKRIVAKASRAFRRGGLDGVGIATLMGKLGLTHGGFYAHFGDKEELIGEASVAAVEEMLGRVSKAIELSPSDRPLKLLIDYYLSGEHRDDPGGGCVVPALAAELARRPKAARRGFTVALEALLQKIAVAMPGKTASSRKEQSLVFFSAMVGSVLLSRAVSDPELSDALLRGMRSALSREAEPQIR